MFVDLAEYERFIEVFPRVCVDILILDEADRVLLLKRTNNPAIGQWWFPGGRIHIGETRLQAAERKLREECALVSPALEEVGTFDLFFDAGNAVHHDVTILFKMRIASGTEIVTDAQSCDHGWFHAEACRELGLNTYVLDNILRA